MTTVVELFGDLGHAFDNELQRMQDNGEISGKAYRLLPGHGTDAISTVLDIDLGSLVLDGWAKYGEMRRAAQASAQPGAPPERVRLVEHRITSTHKPTIELYADEVLLASIALGLEVEVDVHSLDAVLHEGRLSGFHSGRLDVRAALSIGEQQIGERTQSYNVGALLPLGDHGIPLTPTMPVRGAADRPRRRTGLRGVLTAAALVVVFGLGGLASRSVELTSFWPPLQPGTGGSVRSGSEWFVRSGPSKRFPSVGTVAPGQEVRVDCLERGWAKLISPYEGKYVYSRGLGLDSTPPGCPS